MFCKLAFLEWMAHLGCKVVRAPVRQSIIYIKSRSLNCTIPLLNAGCTHLVSRHGQHPSLLPFFAQINVILNLAFRHRKSQKDIVFLTLSDLEENGPAHNQVIRFTVSTFPSCVRLINNSCQLTLSFFLR